jgi:anti-sigma factor RsiW
MNDATLERLMMDAALGALSEDVQELLMAHLNQDEKKVREAEQLRAMVDQARAALREECPAEPDLQVAKRRMRIDRAVQWGGRIMAMAACLVIGFGIARMRPAKEVQAVVREKPANPTVVAVNDARPAAEGELWSAQRIYKNAIEVNRTEKPKAGIKRIFQ